MNMMTTPELLSLVTTNDIDHLAMLDKQVKLLTAELKAAKDAIANKYGEGKHRGELYSVNVTLEQREGAVDKDALYAAFGITDADVAKFRAPTIAVIKVCPKA